MINATNTHAEEAAVQREANRIRMLSYQLHAQDVAAARTRQKIRRMVAIEKRLVTNVAIDAALIGAIVTALTVVAACWIGGV